jgi:hypothetical protein
MVTRRRAGAAAARRLPPPLRGGAKRPLRRVLSEPAAAGVIRAPPTNRFSNQVTRSLETNRRHRREEPLRGVLRDGEPAAQSRRDPTSRGCPVIPRRPRHNGRGRPRDDHRPCRTEATRADLERRDAAIRKMLPKRSERRRRPIRRVPNGRPRMPNRCRLSYGRTPGDGGIVSPPRRKHFSTARSGRPEATGPTRQPPALARGADAGIAVCPRATAPVGESHLSDGF